MNGLQAGCVCVHARAGVEFRTSSSVSGSACLPGHCLRHHQPEGPKQLQIHPSEKLRGTRLAQGKSAALMEW